jgi:hypothetical protein
MTEPSSTSSQQPWSVCAQCQRRSTWPAAFITVYSFHGPRPLCPRCAERRRVRSTYRTWGWAAAALLLIPAAVGAGILPRNLWLLMGWGGVLMAMYLSVLPHEFGHALMAKAVGYRPLAIVWGGFPSLMDRRIFGVRTLIGLAPESGFACFDPVDDRWPRLKQAAVTAAGPLANALLAIAAFFAAAAIAEPFTRSPLKFALLVFGIANTLLALANLWPTKVMTAAGSVPSDGARLLSLLVAAPPELAKHSASACQVRMFFAFRDRAHEFVLSEADAAEALIGPTPWIDIARSAALCHLDRPAEARDLLRRTLTMPDIQSDPAVRAMAENNFAWANFVLDDAGADPETLERSARAFEVLPWLAPIVVTRVCALAAHARPGERRLAEASALLARIGELELNAQSRAGVLLAAGFIAAAQGDTAAARRQLELARAVEDPGLVGRVLEARLPSG